MGLFGCSFCLVLDVSVVVGYFLVYVLGDLLYCCSFIWAGLVFHTMDALYVFAIMCIGIVDLLSRMDGE